MADHGHGAPRASRPSAACGRALRTAVTRAHAAAGVQLCDEGQAFVVIINERTERNALLDDAFYLTEESRYAC